MARRLRSPAPALPGLSLRAKRVDVEGPIHRAILAWLRFALPGAVIHHSVNEIAIGAPARARVIAQVKAGALGRLKGFPDLLVIWRGQTWGIEVKAPGEQPTEEQIEVGRAIEANGGRWGVARSIEDAQALVSAWLADSPLRAAVRVPLGDVP